MIPSQTYIVNFIKALMVSGGDIEFMGPLLKGSTAGPGPRFGLIVHRTDADREWACDRKSPVRRR